MTEKFDPAPHDKHAETPEDASKADREMKTKLDHGLIGTFPASDPVSVTQPSEPKPAVKRSAEEAHGIRRSERGEDQPADEQRAQDASSPSGGDEFSNEPKGQNGVKNKL